MGGKGVGSWRRKPGMRRLRAEGVCQWVVRACAGARACVRMSVGWVEVCVGSGGWRERGQ